MIPEVIVPLQITLQKGVSAKTSTLIFSLTQSPERTIYTLKVENKQKYLLLFQTLMPFQLGYNQLLCAVISVNILPNETYRQELTDRRESEKYTHKAFHITTAAAARRLNRRNPFCKRA